MLDIILVVSNDALRAAIVEQLASSHLKTPIVCANAALCLKEPASHKACILLFDQGTYDKEATKLLRDRNENEPEAFVLLLGPHEECEFVTESFPLPLRLGHLLTRLSYYSETVPLLRTRKVEFGPYLLETQNRHIVTKSSSEPIKLTEKETALLLFLAESSTPATRRDILAGVWGYDEHIDTHTLETHIYQLRRKLDKEGGDWLLFEGGAYRLAREQE